ncbi:hypothetical protein [Sphaerochaeta sp.]|uniref:hypothetical protein n=1 Tax=Sphaerochaeta sp. TaxID=1972642 RepID=UPI003D12A7BC
MKERPIIMGAESVRAILEGRKTQTRRVIDPHKYNIGGWDMPVSKSDIEAGYPVYQDNNGDFHSVVERCPYGKVGDRLWVRETWKPGAWRSDGRVAIDYQASPELAHTPWIFTGNKIKQFIFRWLEEVIESGLEPNSEGRYEWKAGMSPLKWKSPIFMPRWASRITLEITDIRVDRVQDITEDDALAEGCSNRGVKFLNTLVYPPKYESVPIAEYYTLWDKLNAKRGYPWEKNPWVWVLTFKVVQ